MTEQEYQMYAMNQVGRNHLRDALAGCLKTNIDPERYADACVNDLSDISVFDGQPEASFEVRASNNIHGVPFTIDVVGSEFFDLVTVD